MADEPQWEAREQPLSAEEVASSTFPTAFRGFDPVEVRTFLARVADEFRAAAEREAELRAAVEASGTGAPNEAHAEGEAADAAEVEALRRETERLAAELEQSEARLADREATLADREDRVRVRDADAAEQSDRARASAQEEATRLVAEAKEDSSRFVREAREEAARVGSEADRILAQAKEGAASAGIEERREAERDAAVIRVKAREEADAIIEAAKERGREMVGEAQAARERMLKDLAKRRRSAQAQLEHLKEARDRVLEHLRLARRAVDDITTRFEPAEARWDVTTAAEPAPGAPPRPERTQIDAVQAQEAVTPPQTFRETTPLAAADPPSHTAPAPEPPDAPDPSTAAPSVDDDVRPVTREERKSSALRILRRGRSQPDSADQARAVEAVEGVRLIGPAPRVTPEASAEVGSEADDSSPGPVEPTPDPRPAQDVVVDATPVAVDDVAVDDVAVDDVAVDDEAVATDDEATTAAAAGEAATEAPDAEREPVRPGETLDELFARLRAGREDAVAPSPDGARRRESETPVSDADELSLQRRDVAVEEAEATMARRLKRALQDEQNAVLDALRTGRGPLGVDALVGPLEAQQQRFRRLGGAILGQASASGAAAAASEAPAVDDLVDAFATEVSAALRDRLQRALTQAREEELDPASVAERLNAVYRDFKGQRAERISGHFVIAAHARGAFGAVPEGTSSRWVVDDGGPCPDCDDNALAGAVVKGDAYPTGQIHPPAHVGCRCVLVPASPN